METNGKQGHSYFFLELLGATFHLKVLPSYAVGLAATAVYKEPFFVIRNNLAAAFPTPPSLASPRTDVFYICSKVHYVSGAL